MKRILMTIMLGAIIGSTGPATAANDSFGLAWGVSLPTGDTADYISNVSFRGASTQWRHYYRHDASYGLNIGWNVFNKSSNTTLTLGDLTATGNLWQYINAVPIYADWCVYFETDRRNMRPYVGLNAGTAWIERRTEMGLLMVEEENWHLAVAPEFGVNSPYDWFIGYVALRYHYAFPAGGAEAQQWLELKIGFSFD
jgi:hypothetical protein